MYERAVRQINEALKRKRQRELLERFANGYKPEMKDTWKPTPVKKKHPPRPDLSEERFKWSSNQRDHSRQLIKTKSKIFQIHITTLRGVE